MTERNDEELLDAWKGGDNDAGNDLLGRRFREITWFFRNKVTNEADVADLVSQTFLGCLSSRDAFRGETSFRRFLYTIAQNVLREYIRKKTKRGREQMDFGVVCINDLTPISMSSIIMRRREAQAFVDGLRRIPVTDQIVLELKYFEGLTGPEIAETLDIPEGTVRGRLRRGLERLRDEVGKALGSAEEDVAAEDLDKWAEEVRSLRDAD